MALRHHDGWRSLDAVTLESTHAAPCGSALNEYGGVVALFTRLAQVLILARLFARRLHEANGALGFQLGLRLILN